MRIVYVTSNLPRGKKGASIIPEMTELDRRGHDVLTVSTYPRAAVLHDDVEPLLSDVVSRPLLSVDLAGVAVRPFGRIATAASETLGSLLFSRGAGGLLRKLVVYMESLWLAGIARY